MKHCSIDSLKKKLNKLYQFHFHLYKNISYNYLVLSLPITYILQGQTKEAIPWFLFIGNYLGKFINEKVKDINKYSEEEQLIISAIEKQKDVKEQLKKKKIDMNPLILIQIPDKVVIDNEISTEDLLLNKIKSMLEKNNYKEGYQYAIWLSDNKTTRDKESIVQDNSSIEILIFKAAIATGWDIPRANILVRIREAKTKSFNIQTLGRILRNPFFKYYNNDLIDNAFVFTKDENYKEYIKQENIVNDETDFITLKRSPNSKNSSFAINKVLIERKDDYDENKMFESIALQIIENKNFVNTFFKYNEETTIVNNLKEDVVDILKDGNKINEDIQKQRYSQISLNLSKPKITLFDLYIKYRTITKSSHKIESVLQLIETKLSLIKKTIKGFYNACCHNWNKNIFSINNKLVSLKEFIEIQINAYLSKHIQHKEVIFKLPNEYKVINKYYDDHEWDKINTFNAKWITNNASINEKEFYKAFKILPKENNIHIFRNGTSVNVDYYIEYIDSELKIRKFFPDFILIDETSKKCFVVEAKGNKHDIDKNSKNKFDKFKECLEKNRFKNNYKCISIIKTYTEKDETEFEDINLNKQIELHEILDELNKK